MNSERLPSMRAAGRATRLGAAAALLLLPAAFAACTKVAACRPGTLFVSVDVGPYTGASRLDVDLAVDGAAPHHESVPLASGVRSGGVEVTFHNGYPAGKPAQITLTLMSSANTPLASRTAQMTLAPECATVAIDFASGDGGDDVAPGSGGRAAGTGGEGGDVGTGGATAGTGGAVVVGTGGAAGTPGTGGAPASTGGAGGRVGTGGVLGSGGTRTGGAGGGGRAGTGGVVGTGGAGGACVARGAENCFNNIDDDCDGKVDCADTECAQVGQCVALDPQDSAIGVSTNAGSGCPPGYGDVTPIMADLVPGACTGCSCGLSAVRCSATVFGFMDAASCASGNPSQSAGPLSTSDPCTKPPWVTTIGGNIFGFAASAFTPQIGTCSPSGAPTPQQPGWNIKGQFCGAPRVGAGCGPRSACVPIAPSAPFCQMFDGARTCPAGLTRSDWFTSYQGSATCGPCTCGGATGASCASMRISSGSDYGCGLMSGSTQTGIVGSGGRACYTNNPNGVYQPGVQFTGTATPGTCAPSSTPQSTLTPAGPKTVCCL